ncbi:uncharacterized protein LOC142827406 [Pelodiscus sinensis]|uniref:uncharacterized protein LOC142827406 n=1 Tax=Pelodiscus sinensis TaxID=13735 RepID=UPI003F6C9DE0
MAEPVGTISMPALGRPFQLGMLYDCRNDSFIPGITLWDLEKLRMDVNTKSQCRTEYEVITSDTIEEKASVLNVPASLKASFLGGLVEVDGSARYLNDTQKSKQQARVTLKYSATTRFEHLTMSHLGAENVSYPVVFDQGTATHVVTAVLYGAQAFFVFDQEVSSSESVHETQRSLQVMIEKITQVSIEGEGALKMNDMEKAQTEKLSCKFYGDFGLESNPVTYQDAMKTYSTLPTLLGDGEKIVPVKVWLYPLTKLDSHGAQLVREISIELIFNVQTVLEQLTELDSRCNDALKNRIASTFPEIQKKIQQFKDLCKQHRQIFQKQLAGLLPLIRGGGKEEGALVDILSHNNRSPFNAQKLNEFLDKREREMNFVNSYLSFLRDVEVVVSLNKLDEIVLDPMNDLVIAFVFTSLHEEESYLSDLKLYLQTHFMKSTQDPASASSVHEKSKLWFESPDRNQKARKSAKSIADLAHVNKSNEKTRFIVASVPDEHNPGTSIYLYKNGDLVSTNYEPPSKPLFLLIDGVRHDQVQLIFKSAGFERDEISCYHVEYRIVGQENWTAVVTNDKQETLTVAGLCPNTKYQFRYAAMSRSGVSVNSDVSDPVKMLPTSPPGMPKIVNVNSSDITLSWESPSVIGNGVNIKEYKVEYKEKGKDERHKQKDKWLEKRTGKRTKFCTIHGLRPETPYRFRVLAVCVDGAVSYPGEEVSISTSEEKLKTLAQDFCTKSTQIGKGQPSVYALPTEKVVFNSNATHPKYRLGKENLQMPNKVIMVIGTIGSGKTTLINGMINYVLGVQWEDEFRFKLIHETTNRSQAESQTSEVTAYEVNHTEGFQVPYSLTIIDTPGFGNTRESDHDSEIKRQIREFFSTEGAIGHIDAICIVVQASLAHLTRAQKYVFDSVLSIFGKDIKDNILILITFADGQMPPVLEAIKTADVPCVKDAQGNPVHFKFNNSMLFACNAAAGKGSCNSNEMFWKMGAMSMQTFFESLLKLETRILTLTQEVLREQKELENTVEELQPQIKAGLVKLEELRKTQEALEQHKDEMETNRNFEYVLVITVPVQIDISGTGKYVTNCQQCYSTCHYPCKIPNDNGKHGCAAMDRNTGYCTVCPGKCFWNVHFNQKYRWEYKKVIEKLIYADLKEKYEKESGEVLAAENVFKKLSQEYSMVQGIVIQLIDKSSRSLQQLQSIATKPNPLSVPELIDLMIMSEQQEQKPGYQERIKSLQDVREVAEIIRKIANNEDLLPAEEDLYKRHAMESTEHSSTSSKLRKELSCALHSGDAPPIASSGSGSQCLLQ